MITRLYAAALRGVDAREVEVEVNVRGSEKPLVIIVGLPDGGFVAVALADGTRRVQPTRR